MEAAAAAAIVDAAITAGRASGDAVALPREETNASSATPRMRYETFAQCDHYADDRQRRCLHAGKGHLVRKGLDRRRHHPLPVRGAVDFRSGVNPACRPGRGG
jgi:hypothetical protein